MALNLISQEEMLSMPPANLCSYLVDMLIPKEMSFAEVISPEDMDEAAKALLVLSSNYSYLVSLLSYAKIAVRNAKRSGDKTAYEDMVDRKEVISNTTDAVKQLYQGISRAVTIRIENNRELQMLGLIR